MRRSAASQSTALKAVLWPHQGEQGPLVPPLVPDMAD